MDTKMHPVRENTMSCRRILHLVLVSGFLWSVVDAADAPEVEEEIEELVSVVADTASMSWEERWQLSQDLMMAPVPLQDTATSLLVNRRSLEAHRQNYDAYNQRVGRLQRAEHLTEPERAAAISAMLDALMQGETGAGAFMESDVYVPD
jgi:hypothetical protein